jgi:hypothetical protein
MAKKKRRYYSYAPSPGKLGGGNVIQCERNQLNGCAESMCNLICITRAPSGAEAEVHFALPRVGPIIGNVRLPPDAVPGDKAWAESLESKSLVDFNGKAFHQYGQSYGKPVSGGTLHLEPGSPAGR